MNRSEQQEDKEQRKKPPKAPSAMDDPSTPTAARPTVQLPRSHQIAEPLQGSGEAPPTPTDYQVVTESCDWCLVENLCSDDDGLLACKTPTAPPKVNVNPPAYAVHDKPRKTLGIPMI